MIHNECLVIKKSNNGLGLFTNKELNKNEIIFNEKPLIIITNELIDYFVINTRSDYLHILSIISSSMTSSTSKAIMNYILPCEHYSLIMLFSSMTPVNQSEILQLCCPEDSIPSYILDTLNQLAILFKNNKLLNLQTISIAIITKLIIICASNVFGDIQNTYNNKWIALFSKGCRINHSCSPNSVWEFDGNELIVTAINIIPMNDEITQSYIERERWYPVHIRKATLYESRYFKCNCDACIQEYDNKRRFKCKNCHHLYELYASTKSTCINNTYNNNNNNLLQRMKCRNCNIIYNMNNDTMYINSLLDKEVYIIYTYLHILYMYISYLDFYFRIFL
jgi:hypothetical protein